MKKMHLQIVYFFLILLSAMPYCLQASPICSETQATAVSIQGKVDTQSSEDVFWSPVNIDHDFCYGDKIRTSKRSRATLIFKNGFRMTLKQNSTLSFASATEKETSWIIKLMKGSGFFRGRQSQHLRVKTPFISFAHEGTEFLVTVNPQQTEITVYDGQVAANNQMGEIHIKKGYTGIAAKNQPPTVQALTIRPEDAVQWSLYYPPIIDVSSFKKPAFQPSVEAYLQGNPHHALTLLEQTAPSKQDAAYLSYQSSLLLMLGSVDEALSLLDQTLQKDPENSSAIALQSIIAVTKNRQGKAFSLAQKAVSLDPQSATAQIALSYAYQSQFKIAEALTATKEAVRLSPDNALAWARLAELHLANGERTDALKSAEKAQSLNPALGRTQTVLGFNYLAQIDIAQAKTAFVQAIKLNSADPLAHLGLGLAKIRKGAIEEGTRDIETAVSLDPDNAIMRSYLGKAYYELRNDGYAATELNIAKEMDPNDPTPWFYDAIRKQTTNRPVEALHDMQKAIELNDNRGVYRSKLLLDDDLAARSASLGRIYNDLGFQQLGLVEGWKSLSANPNNYSAHRLLADNYAVLPRHEKARVSELLQSQLLQPTNITPIQPRLAETDRLASNNLGNPSFNEYNSLFLRNQFTLQGSGIIGNNDSIGGEIVHAGLWDNLSYSLGLYHFEDEGIRENNDIKQDIVNAFLQYQVSQSLNVQFEFRYNDLENGDLRQKFDSSVFSLSKREQYERKTYRFGTNFQPDISTNFLVSAIYSTDNFDSKSNQNTAAVKTSDGSDTYSLEFQYIKDLSLTKLILGGGYANANRLTNTVTSFPFFDTSVFPPPFPSTKVNLNNDLDLDAAHSNVYLYTYTSYKNMTAILGVSLDSFNSHILPDFQQVSPKLGLLWKIFDSTTLRLAYIQSVMGVSKSIQTIEPTQVAGFAQPDDVLGTRSTRFGIGLDHKFSKSIYGGVESSFRKLKVPSFVPRAPSFNPLSLDYSIPVNILNSTTSSNFIEKQNEFSFRSYLNWTPTDQLALSLGYQLKLNDRKLVSDSETILRPADVKTHKVPISLSYFSPLGIYSNFKATFVDQQVSSKSNAGDRFWSLDASLGYRFPNRYGRLELGAKNMLNERYQFEDINRVTGLPTIPEFLPERTVFLKLIFDFGL